MRYTQVEAVIFDQDGVVSDTQKNHSAVESEILLEHGIVMSPREITSRFSGVSGRDMWPAIFAEYGKMCHSHEQLSEKAFEMVMNVPIEEIVPIEGAIELIAGLRAFNVPLAIGSGSRPAFIERVLGALKIRDSFHAIASSKEVPNGKPAPDVFLLAAKRLGVAPSKCIVIEDGLNGMLAARAAGMRCVALVEDMRKQYPADLVIEKLKYFPLNWFR